MRKTRLLALAGAGRLSRSTVAGLSGLAGQLGPVMAPSLRVASRLVNSLRAGYPARSYNEFDAARTILIALPDALLPEVVAGLESAEVKWAGKVVLLCDSALDGTELSSLAARGAATGSLSPVYGLQHRFIIEGHRDAVREARRLLHDPGVRCFEIQAGSKALYLAAVSCATSLFTPLADAAVHCLRGAGLSPAAATAIAEHLFHRSLRGYLHAGRKTWSGPVAAGEREQVARELAALESLDHGLALYYSAAAAAALNRFERDAEWLAEKQQKAHSRRRLGR